MDEKVVELQKAIDRIEAVFASNTPDNCPLVTYEDLNSLPIFTKYFIGQEMWGWKVETLSTDTIFFCEFRKGTLLDFHEHDATEICHMISGKAEVTTENVKTVFNKNTIKINAYTPHRFEFKEDTILLVRFQK